MTVAEVYAELLKKRYEKPRFKESRFLKEVKMNWRNHLEKQFGLRRIQDLTPQEISDWHQTFECNPYAGNRSKSLLSMIFKRAELMGARPIGSNPCVLIPNHPEKKRTRYAMPKEFQHVCQVLAREQRERPREVGFIYCLIFTGCRPSAVRRFKWANVERYEIGGGRISAVIRFAGKTGEEHVVVPYELLLFMMALPRRKDGCIFGIPFPRTLWEKVQEETGCEDLWARDFRRMFGVMGLSIGISLGGVGELLNHKNTQTTKGYTALLPQARLEASELIFGAIRETGISGTPLKRAADSGRRK